MSFTSSRFQLRVALTALALPVTDDAEPVGGVSVGIGIGVGAGKIPPNCATLAAGDINTAAASAIASEHRLRDTVLCMQTSLMDCESTLHTLSAWNVKKRSPRDDFRTRGQRGAYFSASRQNYAASWAGTIRSNW